MESVLNSWMGPTRFQPHIQDSIHSQRVKYTITVGGLCLKGTAVGQRCKCHHSGPCEHYCTRKAHGNGSNCSMDVTKQEEASPPVHTAPEHCNTLGYTLHTLMHTLSGNTKLHTPFWTLPLLCRLFTIAVMEQTQRTHCPQQLPWSIPKGVCVSASFGCQIGGHGRHPKAADIGQKVCCICHDSQTVHEHDQSQNSIKGHHHSKCYKLIQSNPLAASFRLHQCSKLSMQLALFQESAKDSRMIPVSHSLAFMEIF